MKNRSYDDGCATAHALDLIGDRWALLVVRELMFGPKRFTDLRSELRTISANVLTQRLDELEAATIVRRRKLPPPAASVIYELTDWGRALEAPILALGRWAARSPFLQQGLPMSRAGLLLAMRALYRPRDGGEFHIQLDMPHGAVLARGTRSGLEIHQNLETVEKPGAMIAGTPNTLDSILFGGMTLEQALSSGKAEATGDREAINRFLRAFPLPDPLPAD